jgi:hypothetical protein
MSIANITDNIIPGLDVLHDYDASFDLDSINCDWAMNKHQCGAQGRDHIHPIIGRETGNWHGRVPAGGLERLLEAADSLAGRCSRASHQAEARTPVQPIRVVLVTMK